VSLADRLILEQIFLESPAAMALWRGPNHVFELVNPTYQAIFGDRQLVGRPLVEAAPELADQAFPELITRVFETGEPYIGTEMLARIARHPGGPLEDRYYDFKYVRILDTEGQPYGVYDHAIDVTDRVRSKLEIDKTILLLQQERDLRERLVATLSHDLRTPLATARLSGEMLIHKQDDPDQLLKASRRIVDNMDRADAMIRDLLDVSRIRAGEHIPLEIERCNLAEILKSTLDDLVAMHGDRFVFHAPKQVVGYWDCRALRRILENLASNAVKYGARDVPITITLGEADGAITIAVHNGGQPIAPRDIPLLFQMFKRSSNTAGQRGWGIGLSLVYGLAHAHGGTCTVTSNDEQGTTFVVRLPADARSASQNSA